MWQSNWFTLFFLGYRTSTATTQLSLCLKSHQGLQLSLVCEWRHALVFMVAIDMFVTDVTRWHRGDGKPSDSAHVYRGTPTVTASSVFTVDTTALRKCAQTSYIGMRILRYSVMWLKQSLYTDTGVVAVKLFRAETEHNMTGDCAIAHLALLRRWAVNNPLKPELNLICYLLALLGAHHFLHDSRIRVISLTFRRLMSYVYIWSTHSWCF